MRYIRLLVPLMALISASWLAGCAGPATGIGVSDSGFEQWRSERLAQRETESREQLAGRLDSVEAGLMRVQEEIQRGEGKASKAPSEIESADGGPAELAGERAESLPIEPGLLSDKVGPRPSLDQEIAGRGGPDENPAHPDRPAIGPLGESDRLESPRGIGPNNVNGAPASRASLEPAFAVTPVLVVPIRLAPPSPAGGGSATRSGTAPDPRQKDDEEINLLPDPNFDDFDAHWDVLYIGEGDTAEDEIIKEGLPGGEKIRALRITVDHEARFSLRARSAVSLDPLARYRFDIWVKQREKGAARLLFGFVPRDESGKRVSVTSARDGSSVADPFFWRGETGNKKWNLVTAFLFESGAPSASRDPEDADRLDFIAPLNLDAVTLRLWIRPSGGREAEIRIANPKIVKLD